jgi:N-acetylglucosaminyl-diphospho-decaprenol L-rhamnosyltransferase
VTSIAVITIAHGRHHHLAQQGRALTRSTVAPDQYIVVAMHDPEIESVVRTGDAGARVIHHPPRATADGDTPAPELPLAAATCDKPAPELPLAAARNAGAAAAIAGGAEVLIFLDVDCMPAPGLVEAYRSAAAEGEARNDLLCGPVAYLPPPGPGGYDLTSLDELARPHAARPAPAPGTIQRGGDPALFWSLSFALTAATWQRIGGFSELYVGYGGEDTDFAQEAAALGIGLAWVGGARAHHQYHATTSPPVQHLDAILRNAAIFHQRWGWWPMTGWLDAFKAQGLIARDTADQRWIRLPDPSGSVSHSAIST